MRFLFLFLLLSVQIWANYIKNYAIDATLKSNGEFIVNEIISYQFDMPRHGIYRKIPLYWVFNHKAYNLHLQLLDILMDNSDISYQKSYIYENNRRYLQIKIGSSSFYVRGLHTYKISYQARLPLISLQKEDKISINLIGNLWQVPIKNFQAVLHLPFEKEKIRYKLLSSSNNKKIKSYWLDDYTLAIEAQNFSPFEGVTLNLFFPKGLMQVKKEKNYNLFSILLILPLLYFMKILYKQFQGVELKRAITPFYKPPKDINVLEAATLLEETSKNLAPAIIELATKRKISISYENNTPILHLKDTNYSDLDIELKELLEMLFAKRDKFVLEKSQEVALFLNQCSKRIDKLVQDMVVKKGFFKESPSKSKKQFLFQTLWVMIPLGVWSLYYILSNFDFSFLFILIFPIVFGIVGISLIAKAKGKIEYLFGAFFVLGGWIPLFSFGSEILFSPLSLFLLMLYAIAFLYQKIGIYTLKGARYKWQLLGLKAFIKRVKKDEIKKLLQKDALYLDKLLPYAMIFGFSRHWLEQYSILEQKIDWIEGGDIFLIEYFENDFIAISNKTDDIESMGDDVGSGSLGGRGGDW